MNNAGSTMSELLDNKSKHTDCPDVKEIHSKIEKQERRHDLLEEKIDKKLNELIEFTREVVKLQERNNRNSDDISTVRQSLTEQARINADAILRIHVRLDEEARELRESKKEETKLIEKRREEDETKIKNIDTKSVTTQNELNRFKNIALGIALCVGVIFGMGQYIVNSTLNDIRDSIKATNDMNIKSDNLFKTEAALINKKLDTQAQVNLEVDEQLRKITEKIRGR